MIVSRAPCGALFLACLLSLPAHADLRPEWEFGVGATGFTLPDYRGSDESRGYVFPLPYVIYRGEHLRVDRQGLRGIFFQSDRVEINLSLAASPPVNSDENRARQGMPHLDPTLEIGPRLDVMLARDPGRQWALQLRIPARAAIATDLSYTKGVGYIVSPHLNLTTHPVFAGGRWNFGAQLGPIWASSEYHQYYYGVDARFATPERPAYHAPGGYAGSSALVSLTRRIGKWWVAGFARYDTLKGAAFEESPLVRRDYAVMAGIAFAWVFAESTRKVEVDIED